MYNYDRMNRIAPFLARKYLVYSYPIHMNSLYQHAACNYVLNSEEPL